MARLVTVTRNDFRSRFPLPAMAPRHAERVKIVSETFESLQQFVIRLAGDHKVKREVVNRHLSRTKSYLQDITVFIGDVAELYPTAFETLLLNLCALSSPKSVSLQSLLILSCFGPFTSTSQWYYR
ncbi:hypothetical protein JVU11DRAFT_1239 [Chiua virens]|nr:hypothetical protein JVU11DRAFT_1239 [Chiua virens]